MALHCPVVKGIVERRHDHGLVEHEIAVADCSGGRVDGVEEAVGAVYAGIAGPQCLDIGVGLLRRYIQREERRVRRDDVLCRAAVALREPLAGVARVGARTEVGDVRPSTPKPP